MIGRPHRFHGYGSLRFVYRHGLTVRGQLSALKYSLNDRRKTYRVAVVVSRKVSKSAVVRNRIRRRVYEIIRVYEDKITEPYDLVFTVFNEKLATMSTGELNKIISSQLKQAKIL